MDAYDKRALKETLVFLALFVLFLVGLFLAVNSTMPTFAESVAHCRAACEANNMVMKGDLYVRGFEDAMKVLGLLPMVGP